MNVVFVEGKADQRFLQDLIAEHLAGHADMIEIVPCDGHARLTAFANKAREALDSGGVVAVVFDADDNTPDKRVAIAKVARSVGGEFNAFFLPDNQSPGTLEDLLERMTPMANSSILECFSRYQGCLSEQGGHLSLPGKKAMIYAYCEALLPRNDQRVRDEHRDYRGKALWDLSADSLKPLVDFLRSLFLNGGSGRLR